MPGLGLQGLFVLAILTAAGILPVWRIFSRAGFSGWLSLAMVIPVVNVLALYYLAFAPWPSLKGR
jgi:hypothetical protein